MVWYKAECIRECIFNGVRRKPGDIYEGHVKPPHHFEIIGESEYADIPVPDKDTCPYCGNAIPASGGKKAATARADVAEGTSILSRSRLNMMNKDELTAYGLSHGIELDNVIMTKIEMINKLSELTD